jgi:hypothetical protein
MPLAAAAENRETRRLPLEALLDMKDPLALALSGHVHLAAADNVPGMPGGYSTQNCSP